MHIKYSHRCSVVQFSVCQTLNKKTVSAFFPIGIDKLSSGYRKTLDYSSIAENNLFYLIFLHCLLLIRFRDGILVFNLNRFS